MALELVTQRVGCLALTCWAQVSHLCCTRGHDHPCCLHSLALYLQWANLFIVLVQSLASICWAASWNFSCSEISPFCFSVQRWPLLCGLISYPWPPACPSRRSHVPHGKRGGWHATSRSPALTLALIASACQWFQLGAWHQVSITMRLHVALYGRRVPWSP